MTKDDRSDQLENYDDTNPLIESTQIPINENPTNKDQMDQEEKFPLTKSLNGSFTYSAKKVLICVPSDDGMYAETNFFGKSILKAKEYEGPEIEKYIYIRDGDHVEIYIMHIRGEGPGNQYYRLCTRAYIGSYTNIMMRKQNVLLGKHMDKRLFDDLMISNNLDISNLRGCNGHTDLTLTFANGDKYSDKLYIPVDQEIYGKLKLEGIKRGLNKEYNDLVSELSIKYEAIHRYDNVKELPTNRQQCNCVII